MRGCTLPLAAALRKFQQRIGCLCVSAKKRRGAPGLPSSGGLCEAAAIAAYAPFLSLSLSLFAWSQIVMQRNCELVKVRLILGTLSLLLSSYDIC